jgi:hypothetical protein
MNHRTRAPEGMVATEELRAVLQQALSRHYGALRAVTRLERRPSAKRSSFALEYLDIGLDNGTSLKLIFKDLSAPGCLENGRAAKPPFLYDPRREIDMYRTVLRKVRLGTATCYGTIVDATAGRFWLFLENVPGVELFRIGEWETWREVARWLAGFHAHFARPTGGLNVNLARYDADYYRMWMQRARVFRPEVRYLARAHDRAIERLLALPVTIIHGDFYASNVLVEQAAGGRRVCPVDWEMAALAPGLLDLAALTAGQWTTEEKETLALTYRASIPGTAQEKPDAFLEALDYCMLHQAVQWLGWLADWSPPAEQAQDWLGEAFHLAEKLGGS